MIIKVDFKIWTKQFVQFTSYSRIRSKFRKLDNLWSSSHEAISSAFITALHLLLPIHELPNRILSLEFLISFLISYLEEQIVLIGKLDNIRAALSGTSWKHRDMGFGNGDTSLNSLICQEFQVDLSWLIKWLPRLAWNDFYLYREGPTDTADHLCKNRYEWNMWRNIRLSRLNNTMDMMKRIIVVVLLGR